MDCVSSIVTRANPKFADIGRIRLRHGRIFPNYGGDDECVLSLCDCTREISHRDWVPGEANGKSEARVSAVPRALMCLDPSYWFGLGDILR